jgi:hypothetical protein
MSKFAITITALLAELTNAPIVLDALFSDDDGNVEARYNGGQLARFARTPGGYILL